MMCTVHCPASLLCTSLIHLVDCRLFSSILESCSIFLFSTRASGLCEVGTNSISTGTDFSLTTNIPPKLAVKLLFSLRNQLAVSGLLSSYMMRHIAISSHQVPLAH